MQKQSHLIMNKPIENTNLSITSWLLSCGLLYGHLQNGIIDSTKFAIFKWLIAFCLSIFTAIKWIFLLSTNQESQISNLLGDWAYFYGPKLLVDLILLFCAIFVLSIFILLYFSSKHPKRMLFWLEQMDFDNENRSFNKLKLNQSDSKIFIKRMSLLRIIYKSFFCSFFAFFIISVNFSAFKRKKSYYFYYFISSLAFCPQFYINSVCIFGFFIFFYQVSQYYFN